MRKVIFIALSLLSVVGYGQGIKISALPQAGSLTGSELTPVVQNGITKKTSVQSIANLGGGGSGWSLTGNAGTNPATNFIGTTDSVALVTKTNGIERMRVTSSGNVGIGITGSDIDSNKLTIIGGFYDSVTTTYGYASANIGKFDGLEGIAFTNGYSLLGLLYDTLLPNKTNYHYSLGNDFSKVEGDSLKSSGLAGEGEVRLKTPNNTWIFDEDAMYATNGMGTIGYSANPVGGVYTNGFKLTDGTQGAGKVLTSDINGVASWQTLALTDTATLNFGSISANGHEVLTMTVTGAALSDVVSLGIPNASIDAHASFVTWVSSANTVSVKCFNFDGSSFNPASGLFTVKVFK
jgi:hypothetical protein